MPRIERLVQFSVVVDAMLARRHGAFVSGFSWNATVGTCSTWWTELLVPFLFENKDDRVMTVLEPLHLENVSTR